MLTIGLLVLCRVRAPAKRRQLGFASWATITRPFEQSVPESRIKSLSVARSRGFIGVHATGQARCTNPGELS
jgi:hypothetical protein